MFSSAATLFAMQSGHVREILIRCHTYLKLNITRCTMCALKR